MKQTIKEIIIAAIVIGIIFLFVHIFSAAAATIIQGFQGGTGIGTASSSEVGYVPTVASTSPWLTYTLSPQTGGGTIPTFNGITTSTLTISAGSNITVTTSTDATGQAIITIVGTAASGTVTTLHAGSGISVSQVGTDATVTNTGILSNTGDWAGTWQGANSTTFYLASNPSGYLAAAITSLNGLTTSTQVFATSTAAGTFTISSSGKTHTFTIPSAHDSFYAPSNYVSTVNGASGAITNIAVTNADNSFSTGQTVSGNVTSTSAVITGTLKANGTSTLATTTATDFTNSAVKSALVLADSSGHETAYGGASACSSGQVVYAIGANGATTCGANGLQPSGSYLTAAVTSINGDTTAAQKLTSDGTISTSTSSGVTTLGVKVSGNTISTSTSGISVNTSTLNGIYAQTANNLSDLASSTVARQNLLINTSSITMILNATTSAANGGLMGYTTVYPVSLSVAKCFDQGTETSTINLYYNSTYASTSVQTNVLSSLACGVGGNSTTTFATTTVPAGVTLFAHVTSTAVGASTAVNVHLEGTRT